MAKSKREPSLSRQQALDSRPVTAPIKERKVIGEGAHRLTIETPTPPWRRRILRMPAKLDRQFEFDQFGMQVIDMCDGQKPVKHIVDKMVREHGLDHHETERAVTIFLRNLMRKNIVTLYLPKHKGG